MISLEELKKISTKTGLTLYQQEKDYILKLFLFYYYKKYDSAVFKGGTCIKYLYGLDRFSEDLDFNLKTSPEKFKQQVIKTLEKIEKIGIDVKFRKKELFENAFTCEMNFKGPLFMGESRSMNKIRIDAGKREGISLKPTWNLVSSEYPETSKNFLVLTLNEKEILAEKVASLSTRNKGRDLYDIWFLLKKGVIFEKSLLKTKTSLPIKYPSKKEYERDLEKLTSRTIPYQQVLEEVKKKLTHILN